ncbi:MAG: ABC transporter ATP-binding protein [Rhodospirillaceae bacterium]|nr:ABC transporter ATP-binding protein [Rhodospirillaceae bacterium]
MAEIRLERVTRRFGDDSAAVTAVDAVSVVVPQGEILALLGPSGCGKTTLLRIVAGLTEPSEGTVALDGKRIDTVPASRRNVGMLFQNYALFPHMTVAENVAFGLTVRLRRAPRREVRPAVERALAMVQLGGFERRYPSQLSGGQQQRVAFARAIVTKPAVLLLDEPFGALDRRLREDMQVEVKRLVKQLRLTAILVTHDQDEAMTMADSIAVMNRGRIVQRGSARDLVDRPATRFIAEFVGPTNVFAGAARSATAFATEEGVAMELAVPVAGKTLVGIKPERIRMRPAMAGNAPAAANTARGTLAERSYRAATRVSTVALAGGRSVTVTEGIDRLEAEIPPGAEVVLEWDAASVVPLAED